MNYLITYTCISIREYFHAKLIFLFFAQSGNFKCVAERSFLRDFGIGTGYGSQRERFASLSLFVGCKVPSSFVSISNYIREKVSGLA